MTQKTLTKADTMTSVQPRLVASRRMAQQWTEIAARLADVIQAVTAARPAAGTYRDAAAWERDRTAIDRRLDVLVQLERRFASEAARIAEAT